MAISEIKHTYKQTKGLLYPDRHGLFNYEIGFLFREARTSIRIDLLQRLLKYKGYKMISSTSDLLKSDAPLQVIVNLIQSLNSVIRETDNLIKPKVVREQIAILAVLNNLDPFTILERALKEGTLVSEGVDRYSFAVNIDKFLKTFSSNHV